MAKQNEGLCKYIESNNKNYYDGAIAMFHYADNHSKGILPKKGWELLKDLICDPDIKKVMGLINEAYDRYLNLVKEGKVSAEEQQIVKKQVDNCNKMLTAAVNELKEEGRLQMTNKTNGRKTLKIKSQQEEETLKL